MLFRLAPEAFVRKGPVQKLVLKGGWSNRKWNDRWIELSKHELHYCWKAGKGIDRIDLKSIQCVKLLNQDSEALEHRHSFENGENSKRLPLLSSTWPIILHHSRENAAELQNGFFLQTNAGQHAGREYFFRTRTQEEASEWISSIQTVMADAAARHKTLYGIARNTARRVFDSNLYAVLTTLLIALNFFLYVYYTQVRVNIDRGSSHGPPSSSQSSPQSCTCPQPLSSLRRNAGTSARPPSAH